MLVVTLCDAMLTHQLDLDVLVVTLCDAMLTHQLDLDVLVVTLCDAMLTHQLDQACSVQVCQFGETLSL